MSIDINSENLVFVPLEEAIQIPEGLCTIYKNRYWLIHPDKGLIFYYFHRSLYPQCNTDFSIADRIRNVLYPWATIEKVDTVFAKE